MSELITNHKSGVSVVSVTGPASLLETESTRACIEIHTLRGLGSPVQTYERLYVRLSYSAVEHMLPALQRWVFEHKAELGEVV